jgi:alkanesulfonate monooxygenase SsuD/methylene tetrahydromethanopterin reductase-like flavin-dependent oxidoreductase (luciferase family)
VLPAGPVQRPHVPILIAGGGERVTLRQVARHADASNFAASTLAGRAFTPDDVRRKLAALDAYCAEVGRPAESVLRSYVTLLTIVAPSAAAARRKRGAITFGPRLREAMRTSTVCGTPDDLVRFYRPILAAGISYLVFGVFHNDVETVRLLADEVMPALRADWRSPVPWAPPADGLAADAGRGAEPVPLGAWARTR